jgi:hypothetical protein
VRSWSGTGTNSHFHCRESAACAASRCTSSCLPKALSIAIRWAGALPSSVRERGCSFAFPAQAHSAETSGAGRRIFFFLEAERGAATQQRLGEALFTGPVSWPTFYGRSCTCLIACDLDKGRYNAASHGKGKEISAH